MFTSRDMGYLVPPLQASHVFSIRGESSEDPDEMVSPEAS